MGFGFGVCSGDLRLFCGLTGLTKLSLHLVDCKYPSLYGVDVCSIFALLDAAPGLASEGLQLHTLQGISIDQYSIDEPTLDYRRSPCGKAMRAKFMEY